MWHIGDGHAAHAQSHRGTILSRTFVFFTRIPIDCTKSGVNALTYGTGLLGIRDDLALPCTASRAPSPMTLDVEGRSPPLWRRRVVVAGLAIAAFVFFCAINGSSSGSRSLRSRGGYGTCLAQPSVVAAPLLWKSDPAVADSICCNNHRWAERWGSWNAETTFPQTLPPGVCTITFYDVSSGLPLYVAPKGRTYQEFIAESLSHGWPSFREEEVVTANVNVLFGGEVVSTTGTHLGHNLPDRKGNRHCINAVCIAGHASQGAVTS